MVNISWLHGGNDIPFPQVGLIIHQPKAKDVLAITEKNFYSGCGTLVVNKENLDGMDKEDLFNLTNFDIFMSIVNSQEEKAKKDAISVNMILNLIFPDYQVKLTNANIMFSKNNEIFILDGKHFDDFQKIIIDIFKLKEIGIVKKKSEEFNPAGELASAIAEKIKNGRKKVSQQKQQSEENNEIELITRYISVLSVGLNKDRNILLNYTIPQLFDEYNRFLLKIENDFYYQAKMAGAKDLKEVDNWMGKLPS